jgi:hypothetical protein
MCERVLSRGWAGITAEGYSDDYPTLRRESSTVG